MKPPRRPRALSREDAHLWGEIAKLITPLRARVTLRKPKLAAVDATPAAKATAKNSPAKGIARKPAPAPKPVPAMPVAIPGPVAVVAPAKPVKRVVRLGAGAPPAPAAPVRPAFVPAPAPPGLERRERQRISRGLLAIEGRIDLHGLYQAEAHAALVGFLMRARAAGHARVLVVTGKGGEDAYAERGVLRRSVPHWLRGADLRPIVLGFEEAARHHGGAGALYVRLRRR
ncbi:Endonuclease MutS2 [Methylobacterium cerastii]|uniref:Endonuclease MutS2 n=3 Tax=Methylobacterium TaxID=407 RepID=A0ABQ4QLI1_9HYPH|nr:MULTISPECIES: Smr/MutS family protein [Methylobacterium]TXN81203.1 DNA mismatch repair protein MutS [Methylobacterium sp. WL8]GJD45770.1 Endonuclease MutS2 [Methylobacterium cerastii]